MDIKEMIATIQIYIHHRKGIEVNISPNLPKDLLLLMRAHNVAKTWLGNNLIR